jgi:hypothetical protein
MYNVEIRKLILIHILYYPCSEFNSKRYKRLRLVKILVFMQNFEPNLRVLLNCMSLAGH